VGKTIKSGWAENVAHRVRFEMFVKFRSENIKERDFSEELAVEAMILLKWIIKRGCETAVRIHLAQLGCSHLPFCASGNEPSCCTGGGEFLLVKKEDKSYKMQRLSHSQPYCTYSKDNSKDT